MTEFVTQSGQIGSIPAIPNALSSTELDTAILVDPVKIVAYKDSLADQMNAQSGGPKFKDLSNRIAGIRIETSAQGAAILVVDIIDPMWVLPMSGFIQVDDGGLLWPPIDVTFPVDTQCVWRLCQYRASWDADMSNANLTLTFEDRIASLLREMSPATGGISQGHPGQTLGGFLQQLVDSANHVLNPSPKIRLVELIAPNDPNYVAPTHKGGRLKQNRGLTAAQQTQLEQIQTNVSKLFGITPGHLEGPTGGPLTLAEIEAGATSILRGSGSTQVTGYNPVNGFPIRTSSVGAGD